MSCFDSADLVMKWPHCAYVMKKVNQVNKCRTVGLRSYTLHMPTSWAQGFHLLNILDNTFFFPFPLSTSTLQVSYGFDLHFTSG